ncbi:MAG TPA: serine hydrolase domain-containing protein [Solirubrobacterales bacterium]|nr:serine hydrolase domain-containing protein [Solirubrobacterales bacterium]
MGTPNPAPRRGLSAILALGLLLVLAAPLAVLPASAGAAEGACPAGRVRVADGCVTPATARRHVEGMVRAAMSELGLRSTIIQLEAGDETILDRGFGNSMKGVHANPRMYWRMGSIAIPYLIDLLLQLQDEGKLSLDEPLANYRPNFPESKEVTLRMLASVTSGYPDFIQENEPFQNLLFEDPFRQWTPDELIHWAFTLPPACKPLTCFHYAHTNFAILSQVISQVTGKSISRLIRERVFEPLGLHHTQISRYPAFPGPALHAYTGERGFYEDSTFWSPSWTIGAGTVMAAPMAEVVRGFRAMAKGALISRRSNRERISPANTAHLKPFTPGLFYGMGIDISHGWQFQNPFLNGYTGIAAYLPAQNLSLGIVTTQQPRSAANGVPNASILFSELTAYLSPAHEVNFPGL